MVDGIPTALKGPEAVMNLYKDAGIGNTPVLRSISAL